MAEMAVGNRPEFRRGHVDYGARAASGWRRPMRLMLIVVTVAVAMLLDLRVSQATQMPWCAGTNTGDFFHYNCTLPTYEMCVQEVIAGNRGFLQSKPELSRARRSAQGPAEAILSLIMPRPRLERS